MRYFSEHPNISVIKIKPRKIVFNDIAILKCFSCYRYGVNPLCPPNIPALDYRRILHKCRNALMVFYKSSNLDKNRSKSSRILHKEVLKIEKHLWEKGIPLVASFIGGSCKYCRDSCCEKTCINRQQARIPLEAIGVDVAATARKIGVEIKYPPKGYFYRVGLVSW